MEHEVKSDKEAQLKIVKDKAISLLTRRERSKNELFNRLIKLAPEEIVETVLSELAEANYQSDERFAHMLCKARYNSGKGPVSIRHELEQHAIAFDLIDAALEEYANEWSKLAYRVRVKKFGEQPAKDYISWAKQARFLQQRGFTPEHFGYFDSTIDEL